VTGVQTCALPILLRAGVCECIHHHMTAARGSLPVYGTNIIPHIIFLNLLKLHTTAHLPDFLFTWKTITIALSQQLIRSQIFSSRIYFNGLRCVDYDFALE